VGNAPQVHEGDSSGPGQYGLYHGIIRDQAIRTSSLLVAKDLGAGCATYPSMVGISTPHQEQNNAFQIRPLGDFFRASITPIQTRIPKQMVLFRTIRSTIEPESGVSDGVLLACIMCDHNHQATIGLPLTKTDAIWESVYIMDLLALVLLHLTDVPRTDQAEN